MPTFKAAYLIHGDDHGRISERRSKLRAVAEAESGSAGVEVFEGEASTPEHVAGALNAMTFAVGRRFVIADGVERWKDADTELVVQALKTLDGETLTVAFFAREEGRYKTPAALVKAVTAAGGVVQNEATVKGKELPRWVQARAQELELDLDYQAARALIARTGERQQRLLRELEKIALELGPGAEPTAEEVDALVAGSSERKNWTLADAVVAGDRRAAMRAFVELRGQGDRVAGLLFAIVRRVRDAHTIAVGLDRGESPNQIKGRLRMGPWAADQLIAEVRGKDPEVYAPRARAAGRPRARLPRRRRQRARRGDRRRAGPPGDHMRRLRRPRSPSASCRLRQRDRAAPPRPRASPRPRRRRRRWRRCPRRGPSSSPPRRGRRPPRPSTPCPPTPARCPTTTRACPSPPARPPTPTTGANQDPNAKDLSATKATALANGVALPPLEAPEAVLDVIRAGNIIARTPYKWGGGHGRFQDNGYDCSGSVSYALYYAGLIDGPHTSGDLMAYGKPGKGKWITLYANGGHVYMEVAGIRFDTSAASSANRHSRWQNELRGNGGFEARHPPGL